MSNNNKGGIYGKGYYIALVLCATAIGISGYLYSRNTNQEEQPQAPAVEAAAPAPGEADVPAVVIQPRPTEAVPTVPAAQPVPTQPKGALKTASPVSGQTVADYAMDCLSYNRTTRDWRVHNGVDMAAEPGTPVCAAAAGTVYAAFSDDAMGNTVVIRHEGGYTTTYASLAEEVQVSVGETVKLGQAIGTVGTTAVTETAIGPHVHFGVTYRGEPMDPADFLAVG